jgi:hypothetical protein
VAVAETEWEPHVAAIIRVERKVLHFQPATGRWKSSFEISFYLSSQPLAAKTAAAAVRQHWADRECAAGAHKREVRDELTDCVKSCVRDEGRPFEVGFQERASNHPKLLL